LTPCTCENSGKTSDRMLLESQARTGSTLVYGALLAAFPTCRVIKTHLRLAEPHTRYRGPWAHSGPIITTVRDPLEAIISALVMHGAVADSTPTRVQAGVSARLSVPPLTAAFRAELAEYRHAFRPGHDSATDLPFDPPGCMNTSERLVLRYEHFHNSPEMLVRALEVAFRCRVTSAARETIVHRVFNVSYVHTEANRFGYRYNKQDAQGQKPATGDWSLARAGIHPHHISSRLGGSHSDQLPKALRDVTCANAHVRAYRAACGYTNTCSSEGFPK